MEGRKKKKKKGEERRRVMNPIMFRIPFNAPLQIPPIRTVEI